DAPVSPAAIRRAPILVVDRAGDLAHFARGVLGRAGYTDVACTADPGAVAAALAERSVALVVAALPCADAIERGVDAPALLLVGRPGLAAAALAAGQPGMCEVLPRPLRGRALRQRVEAMLALQLTRLQLRALGQTLERRV